jgi:hypothetical protein
MKWNPHRASPWRHSSYRRQTGITLGLWIENRCAPRVTAAIILAAICNPGGHLALATTTAASAGRRSNGAARRSRRDRRPHVLRGDARDLVAASASERLVAEIVAAAVRPVGFRDGREVRGPASAGPSRFRRRPDGQAHRVGGSVGRALDRACPAVRPACLVAVSKEASSARPPRNDRLLGRRTGSASSD